jgi:IclR family transcriptional regulator, KDG regulon repressor
VKTYHLGPRLMVLGQRSAKRDPRVAAAAPSLDALSAQTGETISLALRVGRRRSVVDSRASRHPLQFRTDTTDQISLHWGALGLCLLAFSPKDVQRAVLASPLERYSAQTITDGEQLRIHLELVRERGYDIALETDTGLFSIAAPILDPSRQAVAALAIAGPLTRLTPVLQERYSQLILGASADVQQRLYG